MKFPIDFFYRHFPSNCSSKLCILFETIETNKKNLEIMSPKTKFKRNKNVRHLKYEQKSFWFFLSVLNNTNYY